MYKQMTILLMFLALSVPDVFAHEHDDPEKYATSQLVIDGAVRNRLSLDVTDLRNRELMELNDVPMRCSETRIKSEGDSYRGIPLRDLLEAAEPDIENHRDKNLIYLVASASDDYHVLFSWHEIMNTDTGNHVLVFIEKNGAPIDAKEGYIALIAAKDRYTCSRHIKWLQSITVKKL